MIFKIYIGYLFRSPFTFVITFLFLFLITPLYLGKSPTITEIGPSLFKFLSLIGQLARNEESNEKIDLDIDLSIIRPFLPLPH